MTFDAPVPNSAAGFGADLGARASIMMTTTMMMTRMRGGGG